MYLNILASSPLTLLPNYHFMTSMRNLPWLSFDPIRTDLQRRDICKIQLSDPQNQGSVCAPTPFCFLAVLPEAGSPASGTQVAVLEGHL